MHPVSEYITEIMLGGFFLVFSFSSQKSLFVQVTFHLFILDSVFYVGDTSQGFANLGCLLLFKTSAL